MLETIKDELEESQYPTFQQTYVQYMMSTQDEVIADEVDQLFRKSTGAPGVAFMDKIISQTYERLKKIW